jgi:hypothetical protein
MLVNGERAIELTTDSHPTGNSPSGRSMRGSGKRPALCARFTSSMAGVDEGAADQRVEAESSVARIETVARATMQPLPR